MIDDHHLDRALVRVEFQTELLANGSEDVRSVGGRKVRGGVWSGGQAGTISYV